jgi:hypothetical protein
MRKFMRNLLVTCILSFLSFTYLNAQQPEWVASLAIDPEYYIGISSCEKSVPDYQSIATKKALSLIAEQIQTTVISSNELYTTEHNFNFNEEFIQSVKTTSNITLQDYELYQAWEDSSTYFIYYRLSKQLYRDNLSVAYDMALDNCSKKIVEAEAYFSLQKIDETISTYLEASKFLEPVISNSFIADKYAMVVNQWNDIQSQLLKLLFDFQVQPVKEKLQLTRGRLLSTEFDVNTLYAGQVGPVKLGDIPVIFDLSGNLTAFEKKIVNSDNEGVANNQIVNIYNESLAYTIYCKIDFAGYLERYGDYQILRSSEFSNLMSNCKILVEVIPVIVVINSSEYTYEEKNSSTVIRNELGNYLRSQNVSVQDNEKRCDYIINLDANTRQGNHYEDVYSAFLDVEYKVFKNSNDSLVVSGNMEPVKGVSLNFESAAARAYKNVKEEVRSKLGKEILRYLK